MILRELFESKAKSVGIIFGRFNPPHMGHIRAWEMAGENPAWYVGTNKDTQGPKDPLPYNVKIKVMKTMYPDLEGHLVSETSWLTLASKVYEKHGNIVLNVYTDEEWVTKTLVQYNGKEGAHGYYEFGTIQQQVTPRLSSATALRAAVMADDRDAFSQAAGVDADTPIAGHAFFDVVKHYLMPHAEKAAAKPVKKKVKQPEQDMAEDDAHDVEQRMIAKIAKYKERLAHLKKTDPEAYKREMEKRKTSSRIPPVSTFEEQGVAEGSLEEYGDTAKGQKMLTKVQTRAVDRVVSKKADTDPKYAKKNKDTADRAWDRMTDKDVEENAWDRLQREKALESAGVGIITKQNSTVDVNKNTPKKNLKAFRLI